MKIVIIILITIALSICLLSGCIFTFSASAPNIDYAEDILSKYESEIDTIVNFFLENDIEDGLIFYNDGTIKIRHDQGSYITEKIDNQAMVDAIDTLFADIDGLNIARDGNTISLQIWIHFIQSISSSIAYSINGVDIPELQTPTAITPMSKAGWYYIVEDYEQYRSAGSTGDGSVC